MKTIFIVAPHYPPSSLPPSHRVRLLVNHLPDLGWRCIIFTVDHKYREEIRDTWMEEITRKDVEIIQVNCLHQGISRKFGVGDLGLRMIPYLLHSLVKNASVYKPDFILYPVPPWYLMAIAPLVKTRTKIPYGIDFIDPWVRKIEPTDNVKAKISQWIARKLEGRSIKKTNAIIAVSHGIIDDLHKRYSINRKIASKAIPYGVELSDFALSNIAFKKKKDEFVHIRYIGAISDGMLPVVRVMLQALKRSCSSTCKVEFIGTSYAGPNLVSNRLSTLISELRAFDLITENPSRVDYKTAVQLQTSADILLLIGDLTPYYAASKLMGLIAAQTPFIAFLHNESFPARFLEALNYPYLITYSNAHLDAPNDKLDGLIEKITLLLRDRKMYDPISPNNPEFLKHTAKAMSKEFANIIEKSIYE